jgi:SagB-type dehydrogenase family enzyme
MQRRTQREFSRKELPFDALSKLLFYTWGITGFLEVPALGRLPLKTSPSAGARHPVETYVLGMRIEALEPGLYYYDARVHGLERLRIMRDAPSNAAQFCVGQRWAKEAAALFIMTAVFPRVMWKYPTSRAYRTILLDAGHVLPNILLGGYMAWTRSFLHHGFERFPHREGTRDQWCCGIGYLHRRSRNASSRFYCCQTPRPLHGVVIDLRFTFWMRPPG